MTITLLVFVIIIVTVVCLLRPPVVVISKFVKSEPQPIVGITTLTNYQRIITLGPAVTSDLATGTFRVPLGGLYTITWHVTTSDPAGLLTTDVLKNGVTTQPTTIQGSAGTVTTTLELSTSDTFVISFGYDGAADFEVPLGTHEAVQCSVTVERKG